MRREKVVGDVKKYVESIKKEKFVAGKTYIPPSGKFIDSDDVASLMEAVLDSGTPKEDLQMSSRKTYENFITVPYGMSNLLIVVVAQTYWQSQRLPIGYSETDEPNVETRLLQWQQDSPQQLIQYCRTA